jgi:ferredoxin
MKPVVDMKRCFASQSVCKAIKACPVAAITYIDVDEPIMDKTLECNCAPPDGNPNSGGCDCGGDCGDDLCSCGGSPYGRIVIDYDKCTACGICVTECCGTAIDMV